MTFFTLFTSYRRENEARVGSLERQLRLRGVRSWQDIKDIPHGSETVEQIRRAIREETEGFVAFITPEYLKRRTDRPDIIWEIELPEAAARWSQRGYFLTPLFIGTHPQDLSARCAEEHLLDLARANGRKIEVAAGAGEPAATHEIVHFRAEARAQLVNAVCSVGKNIVIAFRSFPMATLPADARVDIDWTGEVDGAPSERWHEDLLPALRDVRDVLGEVGVEGVDLQVLTRLNAALALGMAIPLTRGIAMTVRGRDGTRWGEDAGTAAPLSERVERTGVGNSRIAVLDLSLIADLERDAREVVQQVGAGLVLRMTTVRMDRGPELQAVARAAATQIGDAVRRLRAQGVNEYHLVLASPAPMAVLVGRQLHSLGQVHTYFSDEQRTITRAYSVSV